MQAARATQTPYGHILLVSRSELIWRAFLCELGKVRNRVPVCVKYTNAFFTFTEVAGQERVSVTHTPWGQLLFLRRLVYGEARGAAYYRRERKKETFSVNFERENFVRRGNGDKGDITVNILNIYTRHVIGHLAADTSPEVAQIYHRKGEIISLPVLYGFCSSN